MTDPCSVKVAVRVRPLVPNEISKGSKEIVDIISDIEQIVINSSDNKAYTFNYVLGTQSSQEELYVRCVQPMLKNLFDGLNVTIFAYGQTGSGKTHTMGTSYNGAGNMGVIPRAVNELFSHVNDQFAINFTINVSFMELYREVLYDLLTNKSRDQCVLEIREDITKGIHIPNLTEIPVSTANEVLDILIKGSQRRATGSTNMNATSSRSHSIFTISIAMQHKTDKNQNKTAKLHLVDLAGSERSKKTGAQGTTFKEGVDINKGLFVLGNVISALGDEKQQNGFIPYRDSSLTRLLKDSLGGNSMTLMIACVSPADYNLEETLSTLRYADRARKIKNKPVVNQDPKLAEINELKRQIKQLQLQIVGQGGPIISSSEIEKLRADNGALLLKIKELHVQLSAALLDKTGLHEKLLILQNANEELNKKLLELKDDYNVTFTRISMGVANNDVQAIKDNLGKLKEIQEHFNILQNDQIKTENEIRDHEETFTILVHNARNSGDSKEIQEKQESHTTRQMVLNSELEEISKKLMVKEQLAKQLAANTRYMVNEQALADMLETEIKIQNLEKEKEELLQQLRNVKTQENSTKISEQRRKRMLELEEQLKELKKKVNEQSKLIKMKEKDEQKIKQLNQEIISMKSSKVKLVKQMREETDRYRNWRQQKERELARVKLQDRKKETEMAKMKVTHEKQKNVLKRKFEEAAALNKRLQSTLLKRKQAQETRFTGKVEKIALWLKGELDVYVNLAEAEATLSGLLEDRATLQHQLDELKNNPEMSDSPEIKSIADDIELRSVQIQDLQQKILDSDEENKAKTRFDTIQTMVEAKHALRTLFDQAAEFHKNTVLIKREMCEMRDGQKDLVEKLDNITKEMKNMEENYAEQLANQEKSCQEKVGILLMQMRGIKNEDVSPESELSRRCQIQEERIAHQDTVIENQERVITALRKQLEDIEREALRANTSTPPQKVKKEKIPKVLVTNSTFVKDEIIDDDAVLINNESQDDIDDIENDPDWRKTPLGKRIIAEKKTNKLIRASFRLDNADNIAGNKRSSEGGCTCRTKCNTIRCGCKKLGRGCGSTCKCKESACLNRDDNQVSSTDDDGRESTSSNTSDLPSDSENTFKKPRVDDELAMPVTQRRLKKEQLFTRIDY